MGGMPYLIVSIQARNSGIHPCDQIFEVLYDLAQRYFLRPLRLKIDLNFSRRLDFLGGVSLKTLAISMKSLVVSKSRASRALSAISYARTTSGINSVQSSTL